MTLTDTLDEMTRRGLTPREVWPTATMAVTYLDGKTELFHNIRVLAHQGFSDPVEVDGTNMTIETDGDDPVVFHLLGVRRYTYEIDLNQ